MSRKRAVIGLADHNGWAVAVTIASDDVLIDRRRVELIDVGLPNHPHHHEGQSLPLGEAEVLVERVRVSAHKNARNSLDAIAAAVSARIVGVAIRECPLLPPSVADRITNYRAQCVADSVLYREALADAASASGWSVHWYEKRRIFVEAADALDRDDVEVLLAKAGASIGPPWRKDHKMAMAAAIVALDGLGLTVKRLVSTK